MRPRNLEEYHGQSHILAPGKLLRRAIEADRIQSLIFYGPPGTGKTSLAQIIAKHLGAFAVRIDAAVPLSSSRLKRSMIAFVELRRGNEKN